MDVRVVATEHALHFFKEDELPVGCRLYRDQDEWTVGRPADRWAVVAGALIVFPTYCNPVS